jgi:hypothetical protein
VPSYSSSRDSAKSAIVVPAGLVTRRAAAVLSARVPAGSTRRPISDPRAVQSVSVT